MAWGSETALGAGQTAIGNTWTDLVGGEFTSANPYDIYHVQVGADNSDASTVTDDLEIQVLATTGTNYDDEDSPVFTMAFRPSVVTPIPKSFPMNLYYKWKVQVRSSGSTDTYDVTTSFVRTFLV